MPYQLTVTNQRTEFGKVHYDAILTDDAGVLPTLRIPRKFPAGTVVNAAFRASEKAALTRIVTEDRIRAKYTARRDDARQTAIDAALATVAYKNALAKIDQDEQADLQAAGVG